MADTTTLEDTEPQLTFTVKSSAESKYTLTLPLSTTISDVKQKLSTSEHANIPPDRQRLIYSGRVLKDADTLESCKIKEGNTVHLVKGAASNARQNPSNPTDASTNPSNNASTTPQANQSNVPTNIAAGQGASNPLSQLTGARYAGFHGLPGMDTFGADAGMGAPPNPDQMLRLLEDPNFASQMNEAMNNPAVVDMLRNNPMIRNNPMARQAIENPEFRRMMLSPDVIRMQMQMQRAMGGSGMPGMGGGGGGADGGMPMPGQTDTTENAGTGAAGQTGGAGDAGANAAGNPFAQLFGGGAGGPGAGSLGGQQQPTSPGGTQNQNQNNPFAQMTQQLMQNPQLMQQMMGMMGGAGGSDPNAAGGGDAGGAGAGFNPFQMFGGGGGGMGGFGGAGAGGSPEPAAPADTRPPEERYEEQLRQLNDMGFFEFDRNVQALRRSGGSVQGAVEFLLSG